MRQSKKNPALAAVLNFSLWGLGYLYVGDEFGKALLIYDMILAFSLILISHSTGYISEISGIFYEFGAFEWALISFLFIISIIFAWHGYEMAKEMNKINDT